MKPSRVSSSSSMFCSSCLAMAVGSGSGDCMDCRLFIVLTFTIGTTLRKHVFDDCLGHMKGRRKHNTIQGWTDDTDGGE